MALLCTRGKQECDGCMKCRNFVTEEEEILRCYECGIEILDSDNSVQIGTRTYCLECWEDIKVD